MWPLEQGEHVTNAVKRAILHMNALVVAAVAVAGVYINTICSYIQSTHNVPIRHHRIDSSFYAPTDTEIDNFLGGKNIFQVNFHFLFFLLTQPVRTLRQLHTFHE